MKKRSFQNVSFKSVEEFLEFISPQEREVVLQLRRIVNDCIPGIEEKLSYNVPFYRKNKNICFVWPGSVWWGKSQSHEGVRFGFTKGYLLSDTLNYLSKGNRKQVFWKELTTLKQADVDMIRTLLFEAAAIDETLGREAGANATRKRIR